MKDCSGQEIVPIKKVLSMHQNRHPNCDGTAWGWIEGCDKNICWSDNEPFNRKAAGTFVKRYHEMQENPA